MKKGFTIMEVLAVVIILGLIAGTSFPIINDIMEKNRKKAFSTSVEGVIRSMELYISEQLITNDFYTDYDNTDIFNDTQKYISGTIVYYEGKIYVYGLSDSEYCANGTTNNITITNKCNKIVFPDYIETMEKKEPLDIEYNDSGLL